MNSKAHNAMSRRLGHATVSRRKAREMGYPETRVIHASFFRHFNVAMDHADGKECGAAHDVLEDIQRSVVEEFVSDGYSQILVGDRLMSLRSATLDGLRKGSSVSVESSRTAADGGIPMSGGLLDINALKRIVARERDEERLIAEIEKSAAGKEVLAATRHIAERSSGFPATVDLGSYFGISECVLVVEGGEWRVATAKDETSMGRRDAWQVFDVELFIEHLLVELGMSESDLAFRALMTVLNQASASPVVEPRTPATGLTHELLEMLIASKENDADRSALPEAAVEGEADVAASPAEREPELAACEADVLGNVLEALSVIIGETLWKDGRGYATTGGTRVKLSKSGRYRGGDGRNFKVTKDHFAYDIFVIWKSEGGGGWAIPTTKLRDFLECVPMPSRADGKESWDPRIGNEDGSDWLWTDAENYGRLDVTPYRF